MMTTVEDFALLRACDAAATQYQLREPAATTTLLW